MTFSKEIIIVDVQQLKQFFWDNPESLSRVRELAAELSGMIEDLSPFMERHTAALCPSCRAVCCINRHSRQAPEDMVFLLALGEEMPKSGKVTADTEPCQFLGESGCMLRRYVRPYRCTWYFCSPLLEQIRSMPAPEYRGFIHRLEQVSQTRESMLEAFRQAERAWHQGQPHLAGSRIQGSDRSPV